MSYTRAYDFLQYVREHPSDFPTWGMRTLFHEDFSFEALEWLGPGHAILWTPHALERLIERIELDHKVSQDFAVISNILKQCSAQISLTPKPDERGRFSFSLRSRTTSFTFAIDCPEDITHSKREDILVKTFIAQKLRPSQTFEVPNALALGPFSNLATLGEQHLWSEDRKAAYAEHIQNLPDPNCRYAVRFWLLQLAHISRDVDLIPQAFNHILTSIHRSKVVTVATTLFLEDECGLRDIGFRLYRYAVQVKTAKERVDSFHTICDEFLKMPMTTKDKYVETLRYVHKYSKLKVNIANSERVSDLNAETLKFREYVQNYGSKAICKMLSISRNAASHAYWDSSEITEEMWDTLRTLPLVTPIPKVSYSDDTDPQEC